MVHADNFSLVLFDFAEMLIGGEVNLLLLPTVLNGVQGAAFLLDLLDDGTRSIVHGLGQLLDVPGSSNGINGVRNTGFFGDDLLGPERDGG